MWLSIITGIVKMLGELASYFNNKQLLDAGGAVEKVKQAEVAEKARDELHDIQKYVATTSDIKRQQLRDKWTAKDE